jgi:predicted O-methyltransferase YrrM
MDYVFTQDWAGHFRESAEKLFRPMAGQQLNYLEIGTYEGRSACWMLDNILTNQYSRAICVDIKFQQNAIENLKKHAAKVRLHEGDSKELVPQLYPGYDIIYIDGDHSAIGCLFDSVAAWRLCKAGGIILWDDCIPKDKSNRVPKAIEAFFSCLRKGQYRILLEGEQFAIQKRE